MVLKNNGCSSATLEAVGVLAELGVVGMSQTGSKEARMEALVGPSCESPIMVNGIETKCLLDSGSQVTVVAGFYREYLSGFPLQSIDRELIVTGAGGKMFHLWGM